MIKSAEDLAYITETGSLVMPSGPCSAWPKERNGAAAEARKFYKTTIPTASTEHEKNVKATAGAMAANLARTAAGAITSGKVSQMEREERYEKCRHCPELILDSKRCAQCGCFMEFKTWIKAAKCPIGKW